MCHISTFRIVLTFPSDERSFAKNNEVLSSIAKSVTNYRKQQSLTQKELASKVGIHPLTISRIERAKKNSRIFTVVKISRGLEISVYKLLSNGDLEVNLNRIDFLPLEKQGFLSHLGRNILKIRKKNNMTQRELADKVGLNTRTLRRIEKGRRNITVLQPYTCPKP